LTHVFRPIDGERVPGEIYDLRGVFILGFDDMLQPNMMS